MDTRLTPRRTRVAIAALAFSLAFLAPETALGQWTGALELSSGLGRGISDGWMRETRLMPVVDARRSLWYLSGRGLLSERAGAVNVGASRLTGALTSRAIGPFRLSLDARVGSDSAAASWHTVETSATTALSARVGNAGAWAGVSARSGGRPGLVVGAWRPFGGAVLSLQTTRYREPFTALSIDSVVTRWDNLRSDSVMIPTPVEWRTDTTPSSAMREWSDLEARLDWGRHRWTLRATLGSLAPRDSGAAQLWGRMHASLQLTPRFAFTAGFGSVPAMTRTQTRTTRFASFGVRLSPWGFLREPLPAVVRPTASTFRAMTLPDGLVRFELHAPSARTVEIAGDFNGWRPVELRESSVNRWEVTLAIPRGTHRLSIRVNGDRWTAPPGMPSVEDEFNARVGLLVIR